MQKTLLLESLCEQLQQEINATRSAVDEAHALASHEQSKPENQYDTLALEAAYLAHGQSERIAELQRQLLVLNHFEFVKLTQDQPILVGSLVCLVDLELNENQWLWILPVAGGKVLSAAIAHVDQLKNINTINTNELNTIRSITPTAPLAKVMLGKYVDDVISLNMGGKKKQFEVIELL